MEKLSKHFPSLTLCSVAVLTAFSFPYEALALTIYQQLTDSSAEVEFGGTISANPIGSFQVTATTTFSSASFGYGVFTAPTSPITDGKIRIQDVSPFSFTRCWAQFGIPEISTGADNFLEALFEDWSNPNSPTPCASGSVNSTDGLTPGKTYYIYIIDNQSAGDKGFTRTNLSQTFWYGYITDDGLGSVPLVPGLPGFTDVGISTTSQQTNCHMNFSTTTGLLDTLGRSISLGFCNVGTFLFVPSSGAVGQYQNLPGLFATRFPFVYVHQIATFRAGQNASSTEQFASLKIDLASASTTLDTWGILPTELTLFSSSTMTDLAPSGFWSAMRAFFSLVLSVGFATLVYKQALHVV